jgi:peptidoglycan/LPS O-acetylase OafA/YrhL
MHGVSSPVGEKIFFPNLDALRFFAFIVVYLRHGFGDVISGIDLHHYGLNLLKDGLFNSGDVGVAFFFVLSGFLITYLVLKEIEVTGRLDVAAFYVRRCLRIWPLYALVVGLGLTIAAVSAPWLGSENANRVPAAYFLLFLSNFGTLYAFSPLFLAITWSVSIEEQFYVVWPQLFARVPRRAFAWIFVGVVIVSLGFRAVCRNSPLVLMGHTFSVMSDLAVGGLVAYAAMNSRRFLRTAAQLPRWQVGLAYAIGLTILLYRDAVYQIQTTSVVLLRLGSLLVIFRRLILSVFFAFIILEQNWAEHSLIKVSRFKRISHLGRYTYGLYLLHPLGLLLASVLLRMPAQGTTAYGPGVTRGLLGLGLSLVLSIASYHAYEMPFLKLKTRFAHLASGSL